MKFPKTITWHIFIYKERRRKEKRRALEWVLKFLKQTDYANVYTRRITLFDMNIEDKNTSEHKRSSLILGTALPYKHMLYTI